VDKESKAESKSYTLASLDVKDAFLMVLQEKAVKVKLDKGRLHSSEELARTVFGCLSLVSFVSVSENEMASFTLPMSQ
jgi:hypothetical protein